MRFAITTRALFAPSKGAMRLLGHALCECSLVLSRLLHDATRVLLPFVGSIRNSTFDFQLDFVIFRPHFSTIAADATRRDSLGAATGRQSSKIIFLVTGE